MLIAPCSFLISPTLRFHCCKATCKGYLAMPSSIWPVQWHEEGDTNCSLMAEVPLAGGEVTSSRLFCFSWQLLLGFVRSFLAHRLFSCEKQRVLLDFIIFCFHWLLENKAVTNVTEKKGLSPWTGTCGTAMASTAICAPLSWQRFPVAQTPREEMWESPALSP